MCMAQNSRLSGLTTLLLPDSVMATTTKGTTMKISYVITECRDKISANCAKSFQREVKRGRPQVNCDACKAEMHKVVRTTSIVIAGEGPVLERECPCGNKFNINPGRGRKASKCSDCREAGTVYRTNDEGTIEAIRAETIAEELREKAEQAGRERAESL